MSLNHLAELIAKVAGSEVEPGLADPRPEDIKHSLADLSEARRNGAVRNDASA